MKKAGAEAPAFYLNSALAQPAATGAPQLPQI